MRLGGFETATEEVDMSPVIRKCTLRRKGHVGFTDVQVVKQTSTAQPFVQATCHGSVMAPQRWKCWTQTNTETRDIRSTLQKELKTRTEYRACR